MPLCWSVWRWRPRRNRPDPKARSGQKNRSGRPGFCTAESRNPACRYCVGIASVMRRCEICAPAGGGKAAGARISGRVRDEIRGQNREPNRGPKPGAKPGAGPGPDVGPNLRAEPDRGMRGPGALVPATGGVGACRGEACSRAPEVRPVSEPMIMPKSNRMLTPENPPFGWAVRNRLAMSFGDHLAGHLGGQFRGTWRTQLRGRFRRHLKCHFKCRPNFRGRAKIALEFAARPGYPVHRH